MPGCQLPMPSAACRLRYRPPEDWFYWLQEAVATRITSGDLHTPDAKHASGGYDARSLAVLLWAYARLERAPPALWTLSLQQHAARLQLGAPLTSCAFDCIRCIAV
jgi:hypothetical protein